MIIKGPYNGTWNGLNIGNTLVGFNHKYSYRGRRIQFDSIGETDVDIILSGLSMSVDFVGQEFDAAAIDTMRWPWHATIGQMPVSGVSMWELAKPLILTSCKTGVNPMTITFYKTILAPDFEIDTKYSHEERPLGMRMMVFPVKYDSEGYATPELPTGCEDNVYFEQTLWP